MRVEPLAVEIAEAIVEWFSVEWHRDIVEKWRRGGVQLSESREQRGPGPLDGLTVVITGALEGFTRDSAAEAVSALGGKVAGSVSKATDLLVQGDPGSKPSSKRRKAEQLGVPIVGDAGFRALLETGLSAALEHRTED